MYAFKVKTDIFTNIAASQVGRAVIMYVETFKSDIIAKNDIIAVLTMSTGHPAQDQ
jgi:hypothetical protein